MRALAIALLGAIPAIAGAQTEKVDLKPVQPTAGMSVVVAKFASKKPVADANGAYPFVEARSVAGAPLPARLDISLPSAPKNGDRPVIMLVVASPAGALTARQVLPTKKGIACAPIDWFAENGLTTGPGAIIPFPPKDICFPIG